jgi:heat shock protein HtpX
MVWAKRIVLFLAVNFLVVISISLITSLLGVPQYLAASGINYGALMIFCLVWGMGGALISLSLSRVMAKWMMGVKVIDPNTTDPKLRELVQTVHSLARRANLPKMPQVGVYNSPEVNAFATGPTKSRSLVAVSAGLLQRMDRQSIEGVLGHEIAHVANGDMVTLTLIQGVVNAFVMFLARAIAFAINQAVADRDRDGRGLGGMAHMMVVMVLEMVLMILGSMVVFWFSRWREFRADAGGAQLAGRQNMITALQSLAAVHRVGGDDLIAVGDSNSFQAFKISTRDKRGIARLFMTHPPLEERIQRLQSSVG